MVSKPSSIPLAISLFVFFAVFNYFYTTVYLTPLSIPNVNSFVAPDDQPTKIILHIDRGAGITAYEFWYEWPYDGFYKKLDKEPVIVYIKGDKIYAVAFRVHYNWREIYHPKNLDIWFLYRWHTPMLGEPPSNYVRVKTPITIGTPPEHVDVWSLITIPTPLNNPFVAAIIYGVASAIASYILTSRVLLAIESR